MMSFCISADQLRKALVEIEAAERNGFMYCLSVFEMSSVGSMICQNLATYSDMLARAHPTDGNFNWGRFQRVTQRFRFKDGKLIPLPVPKVKARAEAKKKL